MKQLILSQDKTTLYDKQGNKIIDINKDDYKKIYIFCITAENHSILATQLALLLEKLQDEPYPWVCNLFDLDTICNAFKFKNLDAIQFLQYIDERIDLHENLFASDELEICGHFLHEGNFSKIKSKIKNKKSMIYFTPDMSDIFDDIYYNQKGFDMTPKEYNGSYIDINDISINTKGDNILQNKKNKRRGRIKNKKKIIKASKKKNRKKK